MAQFFENFNSQTLNAVPSGFTSRWVSPSAGTEVVTSDAGSDPAMGSQVFRIEGVGPGFTYERVGFEITSIAGSTKDRMAALVEDLSTDPNKIPALILRGAGTSGSARTGYILWLRGGSGNFQIRKLVSGSLSATLASGTLPSSVTAVGATANVEFSAIDDGAGKVDVAATVWETADAKPGTPQLSGSDASPLTVGWAGVGTASANDVTLSYDIGYVGVGTNDDPAPTAPVSSGPTLSSVPATAFPGQSRTVTGTGFGATQGTGGLTIGGVTQTITSWSDTEIIFTTVQGNNKYEAGKTLEVTTDTAETVSDTIDLVADAANGFGYVDMSSPNTTDESSVAFGATPTVVTVDQFEWEDFNNLGNLTVDAQGFVTNVDTEGTFRGRFWDATDSTWGAVETFTASVPGEEDTWPFGKGINPAATKNWTWGRRHPKTNMRVRIYK